MAFPVTLNGRTYTLADFEGQNYVDGMPDAFEDFVTQAGNTYVTTSTSTVSFATGAATFTVAETGKPYQEGTPLRISVQGTPTDFMNAIVTSYTGTTLNVTIESFTGTGSASAWNINIGGNLASVESTPGIDDNASSTAITIESDGDVGIGTTTPGSYQLNVLSDGFYAGRFASTNTSVALDIGTTTGNATIQYYDSGERLLFNTPGRMQYTVGAGASPSYHYWTNFDDANTPSGNEQMRLTADGALGIGLSNPNASSRLHLAATTNNGLGGSGLLRLQNQVTDSVSISFDNTTNDWSCGTNSNADWNVYNVTGAVTPFIINQGTPSQALRIEVNEIRIGQNVAAPGFGNTSTGSALRYDGRAFFSTDDASATTVTSRNAAGPLQFFYQDGNGVGRVDTDDVANLLTFRTSGDNDLLLANSSSQGITVQHGTGNVGIGQTAPVDQLTVGDSPYASNQWERVGTVIGDTSGSYVRSTFGVKTDGSGTSRMSLDFSNDLSGGLTEVISAIASGNVGIGDATPSVPLSVNGTARAGRSTSQYLEISGDVSSNRLAAIGTTKPFVIENESDSNLQIRAATAQDIILQNNGTTTLTATGANKVGIGVSDPDSGTALHVRESDASLSAAATASAMLIERAGNVALSLGTANTGQSTIFFQDTDATSIGRVQYDHANDSLAFWANSVERMCIKSDGSVGVAMDGATPSCKLDVNGAINGSLGLRANAEFTTQWNYVVSDRAAFWASTAQDLITWQAGPKTGAVAGAAISTANYLQFDTANVRVRSPVIGNSTAGTGTTLVITGDDRILPLSSSARFKEEIQNASWSIQDIMKLRPVTYKYIGEEKVTGGLIAEEVEEAGLSEFVEYRDGEVNSLAYGQMVALLVKGMQDQQEIIEKLSAKVENLEKQLTLH